MDEYLIKKLGLAVDASVGMDDWRVTLLYKVLSLLLQKETLRMGDFSLSCSSLDRIFKIPDTGVSLDRALLNGRLVLSPILLCIS